MDVILDVKDLCIRSRVTISSIFSGSHRGHRYSTLLRTRLLYNISMVLMDLSEKTLRHHPATFLALSQMMFICGDHESSGTMLIPRSRTMSVGRVGPKYSFFYFFMV